MTNRMFSRPPSDAMVARAEEIESLADRLNAEIVEASTMGITIRLSALSLDNLQLEEPIPQIEVRMFRRLGRRA